MPRLSTIFRPAKYAPFFELREIDAADLGFVGEVALRQLLRVPQTAQVGGEHVAQIHHEARPPGPEAAIRAQGFKFSE